MQWWMWVIVGLAVILGGALMLMILTISDLFYGILKFIKGGK